MQKQVEPYTLLRLLGVFLCTLASPSYWGWHVFCMSKIILLEFSTVKTCTVSVTNCVLILFGNILVLSTHHCSWPRLYSGSFNTLNRPDILNIILEKYGFFQKKNATAMQFGRIWNYCSATLSQRKFWRMIRKDKFHPLLHPLNA